MPNSTPPSRLDVAALREDLDELALRTWDRVSSGPKYNIVFREESITEENLFQLSQKHAAINCIKFTTKDESLNGADWEWWIGSDSQGWIGLRIQAKKLRALQYGDMLYRAASQDEIQCRVLIRECAVASEGRALYPFYCFYNGWNADDGWPKSARWTIDCSQPANCTNVPDVKVFGCGLAPAEAILAEIATSSRPRDRDTLLPLQRPWSWLFGREGVVTSSGLATIHQRIRQFPGVEQSNLIPWTALPEYAEYFRRRDSGYAAEEFARQVPATFIAITDLGTAPAKKTVRRRR